MVQYRDPETDVGDGPQSNLSVARQRANRRRQRQQEAIDRAADLPFDRGVAEAKEAALSMLDRVNRSSNDISQRLRKKGYREDVIEAAVQRLIDVNIINDEHFAMMVVKDRFERKGVVGPALRRDLMRKGIEGDLLDQAVNSIDQSQRDERLDALVVKKLRTMPQRLPADKRRNRLLSFLLRKGYQYGEIQSALQRCDRDDDLQWDHDY